MKIGILTFHKPINYGAFLQAFSLSNRLKNEFPNDIVEIIDYIAPKEARKVYLNVFREFKNRGIADGIRSIKKARAIRSAQEYLPLSKKVPMAKKTCALFEYINKNYDCLIIGSDAVFNWNQNGFPTAFIPNYAFDIPVFTYAASVHGLRYYEEEKEKIAFCEKAFEGMKYIGVRDSCTEKFVKYCFPKSTVGFCCDPTLFIDCQELTKLAGEYKVRIAKKYHFSLREKYIVFMAADSELIRLIRERYKDEYNFVTLFKNSKYADVYLYDLDPFEWAAVLSGASAVVTSYFHGTLLALKQNVPVISIDVSHYNDEKYEGKLKDLLLTRLNLSDFYYDGRIIDRRDVQAKALSVLADALAEKYRPEIKDNIERTSKAFDAFLTELEKVMS